MVFEHIEPNWIKHLDCPFATKVYQGQVAKDIECGVKIRKGWPQGILRTLSHTTR
jgi:hypothetical protein